MTKPQQLTRSALAASQQQKQQQKRNKKQEVDYANHWSISSETPNTWTALTNQTLARISRSSSSSGGGRSTSTAAKTTRRTEQKCGKTSKAGLKSENAEDRRQTWAPTGGGTAGAKSALRSNFGAAEYAQQQQHSDMSSSESDASTMISELNPRRISSSSGNDGSSGTDGSSGNGSSHEEGYYAIHLRLRSQGFSEADTLALSSAPVAIPSRPPLAATAALIAATSPLRSHTLSNSHAGGRSNAAGALEPSRIVRQSSGSARMFEYMANDTRPSKSRTVSRDFGASRLGVSADGTSVAASTAAPSTAASDHAVADPGSSNSGGDPDHPRSKSSCCSTKCVMLLLLALALTGVVLGASLGVGLKHRRERMAAAAAAGQGLMYQIGVSLPAESAEAGCARWFGSEKRVATFRDILATAYSNVLAIELDSSYTDNITCGGNRVQAIALSQEHETLNPNISSIPATIAPPKLLPTIRKLQSASMLLALPGMHTNKTVVVAAAHDKKSGKPAGITASTVGFNPELAKIDTPAKLSDEAPPPTSYLNTVQILLTMTLPGAVLNKSNKNRADISKAVITTSDSILGGSMKRFFGVPIISIRVVAITAGTSVYGVRPSVRSSTADSNSDSASAAPPAAAAAAAVAIAEQTLAPAAVPVSQDTTAAGADTGSGSSNGLIPHPATGRDKDVLRTVQLPQQQFTQYADPMSPPEQPAKPATTAPQPVSMAVPMQAVATPAPVATKDAPAPAATGAKPQPTFAPQQQQRQQHKAAVVTIHNPQTVSGSTAPAASAGAAAAPEQQSADTAQAVKPNQVANGAVDNVVAAPGTAGSTAAIQPMNAATSGSNSEQNDSKPTADSLVGHTASQTADAASALQDSQRAQVQTQQDSLSGVATAASTPRATSQPETRPDAAGVYFPYGSFNLADYDKTQTCDFAPTAGNSLADKLGRLWSYMDGKECVFRAPRDAALLRTGLSTDSDSQGTILAEDHGNVSTQSASGSGSGSGSGSSLTWEAAPVCAAKPNILNSVVDSQGNLWGWESEKSCAFRGFQVTYTPTYDTLLRDEQAGNGGPATDSSLVSRMRRAGPMSQAGIATHPASRGNPLTDWLNSVAALTQRIPSKEVNSFAALKQRSPNRVETVWENAVACNAAPTKTNTVPDRFGRLWGWVEGKVCAFKNTIKV